MAIFGPGSILNNRYELLREIGAGGFATVFQAHDSQLDRDVAVKIMKPAVSSNNDDWERFKREAKILAQLRHVHIVSVYAFDFLDQFTPFIVLEYLQGKTLKNYLREKGKLDYEELMAIFRQCCQGLLHAHKEDLIHRDLSPNNIFLEGGAQISVKILDFGLSKLLAGDTNLTATGMLIGTPAYMSPEMAKGQKVDLRSDIYALGCILYECSTGNVAFESDSDVGLLFAQQTNYPSEPQVNFGDPKKDLVIKEIMLRCLQKDPAKRFQSCQEILDSIAEQTLSVSDSNLDFHSWSDEDNGRHTAAWWLSWLAPLSLLAAGALAWIFAGDAVQTFAANTLISMNQPALFDTEKKFASFLLTNHKAGLAVQLYNQMGKSAAASGNRLGAVSYFISGAEINLQSGSRKAALKILEEQLPVITALPDTRARYDLLDRAWKIASGCDYTGIDNSELLIDKDQVASAMLKSRYLDKIKARPYFNSILKIVNDDKNLNVKSKKLTLETVTLFLKTVKLKIDNWQNVPLAFMAEWGKLLPEEVEAYLRTRLALQGITGDTLYAINIALAGTIAPTRLDEAINVLKAAINDPQNGNGFPKLAELEHLSYLLLEKKHDYESALAFADQGLSLLVTWSGQKPKLAAIKVIALYHLHRQKESAELSHELVKGVLNVCAKPELLAGADDTFRGGKTSGQLSLDFQSECIVPVLDCLVQTKQDSLAKQILTGISQYLRTQHFPLAGGLQKWLKEFIESDDAQSQDLKKLSEKILIDSDKK